jgi:hypothetical protein
VPDPGLSYLTTTMGLQRHYWAVWVLYAVLSFICEAQETVQEAGMRFLLDGQRVWVLKRRSVARLARYLVDSKDSSATLATVFPLDHPSLSGELFPFYRLRVIALGSLSYSRF